MRQSFFFNIIFVSNLRIKSVFLRLLSSQFLLLSKFIFFLFLLNFSHFNLFVLIRFFNLLLLNCLSFKSLLILQLLVFFPLLLLILFFLLSSLLTTCLPMFTFCNSIIVPLLSSRRQLKPAFLDSSEHIVHQVCYIFVNVFV